MARWLLLLLTALPPALPASDRLSYLLSGGRCSDLQLWSWDGGDEFPGATGGVGCDDATGLLRLSYNLSGGGHYVGARFSSVSLRDASGPALQPSAIGLWYGLAAGQGHGSLSVLDSTGQVLSAPLPDNRSESRVSLSLTNTTFTSHYGGADDGAFHFPLVALVIKAYGSGSGASGSLLFANLSIAVSPAAVDVLPPCTVRLGSHPTDFVVEPQRETPLSVVVVNHLPQPNSITSRVTAPAFNGAAERVLLHNDSTAPAHLLGWGSAQRTMTLSPAAGYLPIHAEAHTAGAAGPCRSAEGAVVAVASPSPGTARGEPAALGDGPTPKFAFGCQDLAAGNASWALGVRNVRFTVGWRWAEPAKGEYRWEVYDPEFEELSRAGFQLLLSVFATPPNWARNASRPKLPLPEALDGFGRFAAAAVQRYGARAIGVEIDNEPNNVIAYKGAGGTGAIPIPEAAAIYASWVQIAAKAVHAVRPDLPVGGLDVSGGDWSAGLPFTNATLAVPGLPAALQLFSGHPYTPEPLRYFGPGHPSIMPEGGRLIKKLLRARDVLAGNGAATPLRVWPSEFGYALSKNVSAFSDSSLWEAAAIAQALVLLRSLPPQGGTFGPLFLFSAHFPGFENEAWSYGLWRDLDTVKTTSFRSTGARSLPLPAAAAYATAARLLEVPTKPAAMAEAGGLGQRLEGNVTTVAFTPRAGRALLALWTSHLDGALAPIQRHCVALPESLNVSGCDGLGSDLPHNATFTRLELQPLPLYVAVAAAERDTVTAHVRACLAGASGCAC